MKIASKKYQIGVKGIIVKNKKALIVENAKHEPNRYSLSGGQIDTGESIKQALEREIKEELGIKKIKIVKLLNVFERMDRAKNDNGLMVVVYQIEANASKIKLSNEHVDYKWVNKEELLALNKKNNFNKGIVNALLSVL